METISGHSLSRLDLPKFSGSVDADSAWAVEGLCAVDGDVAWDDERPCHVDGDVECGVERPCQAYSDADGVVERPCQAELNLGCCFANYNRPQAPAIHWQYSGRAYLWRQG